MSADPSTLSASSARGQPAPTGVISFLQGEALANSVTASLNRAGVYREKPPPTDVEREAFRADLKRLLLEVASDYQRKVCDGFHGSSIQYIAREITARHVVILRDGEFRIGVAQKALNLFLKYAWALDLVPVPPPHCPFDRIILESLPVKCCKTKGVCSWTKMNSLDCYQKWVDAARAKLNTCGPCATLTDWEHCQWSRRSKK